MMSLPTFIGLIVIGAALVAVPLLVRRRMGRLRSLTVWIGLGIGLGILVGAVARQGFPEAATGAFRETHLFLRDIFLSALKMMIVPIVFTSIVSGMLTLGDGSLGRLGLKTLAWYLGTSTLAILVGLLLVNLIAPGRGATLPLLETPEGLAATSDQGVGAFLLEFLRSLIPTNPVRAMVEGNVLQIIVFALLVGAFIPRIPEPHRGHLTAIFEGLFQVMMRIITLVLRLAPLGIYAIFVLVLVETGPDAFVDLGRYALTVVLGLALHAMIVLPLLLRVLGRLPPWRHAKAMSPALLMAFSTSSSSATLPLTLRCMETRVGVSKRVSSFVLPLGATVNMDGTALYECVAALFIAQIYVSQGVVPPITAGQQILVVVTALAASIGAAGIPMAGMVMLGIILRALNLPLEGVGYILAVDRLLDMCRTSVNVWSDSCGCAVIAKSEGETGVLQRWPPAMDVTEPGPG
jgi:proton glutamate symport protein